MWGTRCGANPGSALTQSWAPQEPKAPTLKATKRDEPKEEPRSASKAPRDEPRHREPEPTSSTGAGSSNNVEVEVKETMRCVVVKDNKPVVESRATPKVSRDEV